MGDLLVYKASAGSGKTYNLALEYIKLAIEAESPTAYRNILAVTFTNKATGEMKNRILVQLFNLAYGALDKPFLNNLMEKLNEGRHGQPALTEGEVTGRARNILHHLIHDYDHFRVETIDSFFQSLLTNLAHELELPRSYRVDLNDADVVARAVNRLMDVLQDPHSRARKEGAMGQVMDYMNEQIENERGWNMVRDLSNFAQSNLFNSAYLQHEEELTRATADGKALAEIRKFLHTEGPKAEQAVKEAAAAVVQTIDSMPGGEKRLSKCGYVRNDAIKVTMDAACTSLGTTTQKALHDPESMVKKADAKRHAEVLEDALHLQQALQRMMEAMKAYGMTIGTARETLSHAGPMRLLGQVERLMNEINEETNHVMLAKTPELFSRVVKSDDAPFVFERVGTTFSHIMIDEFQDTSLMQWNNFHKLLVENMAQGNQCMLVGDVKQSIYRWRGGDWGILEGIEHDKDFFSKKQVNLSVNWRSKRAVVEYNNALFERCAPLLDQALEGLEGMPPEWHHRIARIYRDVKQECKPHADGGHVRLAISSRKHTSPEDVMDQVVQQIRYLHDECQVDYGDMGVLVRFNSEGEQFINYLSEFHPDIPVSSDEAFRLTSSRSVLTLVNALRFLDNGNDATALTQLLMGMKGIGLPENDLQTEGQLTQELPELMKEAEKVLPPCLRDEDERVFLRRMPLYELCQLLIARLHLAGNGKEDSDNGQSAYLFYLLDAVLDFLADNPSDLTLFLQHWDNTLRKASTKGDHHGCIYVMSVHKSKGLSRHTILVPFCDWELTKLRDTDILWCTPPPAEPLDLLPVTAIAPCRKSVDATWYGKDKQQELLQQRIDNLNLLYVAFTRAEENLLVWTRGMDAPAKAKKGTDDGTSGFNLATVGEMVAMASAGLLEPQEGDYDEESGTGFKVYASGQPEPSSRPSSLPQPEAELPAVTNPLDHPRVTSIPIALQSADEQRNGQVEFRQSNPAKDFLTDTERMPEDDADDSDVNAESLMQRHYIDRGKLLHRLFQLIGSADDLPKAFQRLELEGVTGDLEEMAQLRKHIERSLTHPVARTWFDGSWTLFNECEILYRDRQGELHSARPDRVMTKPGETVVVDFKFAKPSDAHRSQVASYMRFMQAMGHPEVKGYLWYVMQNKVVPVDTQA